MRERTEKTIGAVKPGDSVKVCGLLPGLEALFRFVAEEEGYSEGNCISVHGPLAQALVGTNVGDAISLDVEGHTVSLTILEYQRNDDLDHCGYA